MNQPDEQGTIITPETRQTIRDLPWNKHATCEGVFLKHLITGAVTNGQFSCHLVRVQAGHEISEHIHAKNWELHEVIAGDGRGFLNGQELSYQPGNTIVIPLGEKHRVVAESADLYLWAKFIPALI